MNQREYSVDLLVTGSYLYPHDKDKTIVKDGGVAIHRDTIIETGPATDLAKKYPRAEKLATEHGLIMPGLINTLTHATMSCLCGLADDLPLRQWLQDDIFTVGTQLAGNIVYQGALLSQAEMIKSGTTSFCDMSIFASEVARATDESGMRAWIGEVLYEFPSPNYGEVAAGVEYVEKLFATYYNHPLINITVNPHEVYSCSPDLLKNLKQLADNHDTLFIIHLSETVEEVERFKERYGMSPALHLENLGLLDSRVVAAHCVMLTDQEISLLVQRDVKAVHCPAINMILASGTAPVPRMLSAGLSVGLGTDGRAGNSFDMFREMNSVAKLHKVKSLDPTLMPAETVLAMATLGGAKVLGIENETGSLEPGKKADLIVLDMAQPHLTPLFNIPSQMVYAARGTDVVHSVINGQIVMKNRFLTTLDEEKILSESAHLVEKIKKMSG